MQTYPISIASLQERDICMTSLKVTWTHFTGTNMSLPVVTLNVLLILASCTNSPVIVFDTFETENLGFLF